MILMDFKTALFHMESYHQPQTYRPCVHLVDTSLDEVLGDGVFESIFGDWFSIGKGFNVSKDKWSIYLTAKQYVTFHELPKGEYHAVLFR